MPPSLYCWVCVIFFACVCVGTSDMTTASDDPSSSALCVVCAGNFPRGVLGGGAGMPPPPWLRATFTGGQQCPKIFFGALFFFAIFSGFVN
jgi:hypothetical protein